MNQDPYLVLGISHDASEDEIKAAYRKLAKKYHPDVNGGSAAAEQKMKEINEAYQQILKSRRNGQQPWQAQTSGGGSGRYGGYNSASAHQANGEFTAARNYIRFGRYEEAAYVLNGIANHNAEWHYLMAVVQSATGNRINALDYARRAVDMDPGNQEYQNFLRHLQFGSQEYQRQAQDFGGGAPKICRYPVLAICLMNLACTCLCNFCGSCGGGNYYGRGGYYGPWR